MTDEIKKLSFHRDYLKKKAVKFNSPAFYNSYKKCRNQVTERIKNAKTQYFKTNLENTKNSKETWDQPRKPGSFTSARRYSKDPGALWSRDLLKIRTTRGPRGGWLKCDML
jgi:hypothetical protein